MPEIIQSAGLFVRVSGTFFRAVTADPTIDPLQGSIGAGRYSRPGQRTLYMSASEEGVAAAMQAHPLPSGQTRATWSMAVEADRIADLRDQAIFTATGMRREDAFGPWQELLARGQEPSSWSVRTALEGIGASGLIDPSRKAGGLWHLVLFLWNSPDAPTVQIPA